MEKTPIWLIINKINPAELAELEKFSAIAPFGGSTDLQKLLVSLRKNIAKNRCPTRAESFGAVFPGAVFRPEAFRQILHKLTELVRKYLTIKELEENTAIRDRLLAERLEKLDLQFLAHNSLQKAEKKLETATHRDPDWHENRFQIRRQVFGTEQGGGRTQNLNLQDFSDDLERSFMLRKLKLSCDLISHRSVYRATYDFGLLDAVLEKIGQSEKWLAEPEIAVYFHCCLALLHPDEPAHFEALKPFLKKIGDVFPQKECREILLLSINYCIRRLNQGQIEYSHEGLELYKLALEQGFLYEKGEISRFTFRNVVGMGLKIGAFEWVENFIITNREKLPVQHRESMVSFTLARLSYEKKDYGAALGFLQKADFHDILLTLAAKTLFLKILFETQELRLLDASVDSFKIFLRRKKVLAYHRDNYQNFLKYLERLLALNLGNVAEKTAFRQAILAEDPLTERDWFLGKLG